MPERWPRFEELPHHLTETKPMPGYIGGPPGRRAVISESQYAEARRAIEERGEMVAFIASVEGCVWGEKMRVAARSLLRRVKGAEDA